VNAFDFWPWYLAAVTIGFGLWETSAIITGHREWTLTYKIRTWLGIETGEPRRVWTSIVFAVAIIGFNVWFIPHIIFGWWGGCC
jgi:hypothetical protein